ncbi:TPA: MptD family putative ECF transporter S component [Streptococcus agalactiae]
MMKLKNVVQIAVLAVIGCVVAFGISMLTGLLGMAALYISAGFAAFVIGPTFVIAARKVQKRGTALLFWAVLGLVYAILGYGVMIPITLIAGIVCELIIGKYDNSKRIAIAFSVAMFIDSMNSILLTKILGVEGLVKYMSSTFSPEQAAQMVAAYTNEVILIAAAVNVVLCLLAGFFGAFINNKFFEKSTQQSKLK